MTGPPLDPVLWSAAFAPVAVLFALVLWGRWGALVPPVLTLGLTVALAAAAFEAGPDVLTVGLGKGLWLGFWILLVVWPALLLFRVASVVGLDRLGAIFTSILPRRRENLLLVAWIFPAFVQGVAGFGTPIAVAAPLLVAMGWGPVRAVAYPLIGYHWSVTFGSMGSSFYMASLTSGLDGTSQTQLAGQAALLLSVCCLVSGVLVLLLDGGLAGLREGTPLLVLAGVPMALTLVGVALLVPAVATLSAATVGLACVALRGALTRRRAGRRRPAEDAVWGGADGPWREHVDVRTSVTMLSPYLYLLLLALPVFLVPASRAWVGSHLVVAPDFAGSETGLGWRNPAVSDQTPLALLSHPGAYILLACALGFATLRLSGLWHGQDAQGVLPRWLRALPRASLPVVVLACVATVLVESGMVSVLARGAAAIAGDAYPVLAPVVGAAGSFMTGSTTSSNALFSPLQAQIAGVLDVEPATLVAAQTAGGNVGNSLAPVIVVIGATTVGAPEVVSRVLRVSVLPVVVLLAVVSGLTWWGVAA